jgi:hypothetical protein
MEPIRPIPKKVEPRRIAPGKPTIQATQFRVGDGVYARYHGDRILQIVGVASVKAQAPHYICELDGEKYIIPKMHLSTRSLLSEVGGGNRRQLELPT